ncbi:MAG TPA: nitrilase-related carbon-nitrogen hydrolase [Verrucomicrobiae bacterium]|nr:nitrilase-related carbon-nitrogen hydrolase [Verrucomicrobiae bacterium]
MSASKTSPLTWPKALLLIVCAAGCFHLAYAPTRFNFLKLLIIGYVTCLVQLGKLGSVRRAFYAGLAAGLLCVAPELSCFWTIFNWAAIPLWIVLAFWTGLFTAMTHGILKRFGNAWVLLLIPCVWTGLEYFRSELYYLKFSWLNVGYAFSGWRVVPFKMLGMYGVGFLAAFCGSLFLIRNWLYGMVGTAVVFGACAAIAPPPARAEPAKLHVAGMQLEFPTERALPMLLDRLLSKHPEADLFVLSEYTLDGPVPDTLKNWCKKNLRFLAVGGKDPAANGNFFNTIFVISPKGEIVFRQAKSVPIQFFKDGLPAPRQSVWNSPWGKIGFCICYDLSYTRVTDRLVKMGAQMLIVPTMDVADWGLHEHQLHARVAPVRAAEYNIPIFRLASSGISQVVTRDGAVVDSAGFPGENEMIAGAFDLNSEGSLPVDRFAAPVCVVISGMLMLALVFPRFGNQRRKSSDAAEAEFSSEENPDKSQPAKSS